MSDVTLEDLIKIALVVPLGDDPADPTCHWGVPILIWGDVGIGKSQRIKRVGALLGLYVGLILPAGRLPEDFAGTPVQDGKGGLKLSCTMEPLKELVELKEGLLYIDEINTARMAVQTTINGVILDRRSGDVEIPPKVRMIAAANPIGAGMDGHPLDIRLANRFLHVDHPVPSIDEWCAWRMGMAKKEPQVSLLDAEKKITKEWNATWPEVFGTVCGYLKNTQSSMKHNKLHAIPPPGHPDRSRAFPTPRMWDWASRVATTCSILRAGPNLEIQLLRGCVGDGSAMEYVSFRKEAKFPTAKQALAGEFKPDKKRLDISYAVYCSVAAYITSIPNKSQQQKEAIKAWKIFDEACEAGIPDMVYGPTEMLINAHLASLGGPALAEASEKVLSRFPGKFIDRARNIYGQATA